MKDLEILFECGDYDYEWSVFGVFKDVSTGELWYGGDSGCSCYGSWEETTREDLTKITDETWDTFQDDAHAWGADGDELAGKVLIYLARLERGHA